MIACCECLNCTGGKVGILSAEPLSLPSQELNINHLRRRKIVLIKLQRCFNVRVSVSDGYQLSENASETQVDTTMTFTVLIVSIEQNEEFQEWKVQYNLAGIKPLLKIGEGVRNPEWNPPWLHPCYLEEKRLLIRTSCFCLTCSALLTLEMNVGHDRPSCKKHVFHS